MLYEIKQRVDQYRQAHQEKPPAENASHSEIEVKLREILADEQQYTGFAAEIAQHFWQSNTEQIKVYVDAGAAILSVDTSTMDRQEQLQAEGVKFAYLNILNQSISQRAQIKLFIEHGNNPAMIESLVRVLQEDLSLLSPEQIVDTHNVSPRLYGVAAKSEIVDLLLKLARPSAKKTALALLAPGQPLRDALDSLRTISPASAAGTVIGDLERDLPQTITSLYNVLELESSVGRETISEEDIIEAAKRLYSNYIEQLKEMAKSGNAAEFWNLFDHTVVNLHVFMKGDQLTRGWQKTKAPITKDHVEKAILALLGNDSVKVPERPSLEDTPQAPEKQQEATVAQAEETIMTSGLLTDDDIQELQRSDDYQKDLTTSVNVIYELLKGKQQLDVIENNIVFSKKIIREAIEQIVSKTPTKIREFNDGKQHRNIPEMIDISTEDTPHDIEQTITLLQTLGYTKDRIAELMQNGRLDFLNLETHSIMQSLEQAHRKHIIDADIYPSKSELMEALKEMIRRHSEKTTSGQADSEVNAEKTEQIMDLETTIDTLREHGKVGDAALDILNLNPTDRLLQEEIDFILTQSILPMLKAAKRNGAIPSHLVFTHSSLSDALYEMVKRRKEYKSKEEQSQS